MKYTYIEHSSGRITYTAESPLAAVPYADSILHADYDNRVTQIQAVATEIVDATADVIAEEELSQCIDNLDVEKINLADAYIANAPQSDIDTIMANIAVLENEISQNS